MGLTQNQELFIDNYGEYWGNFLEEAFATGDKFGDFVAKITDALTRAQQIEDDADKTVIQLNRNWSEYQLQRQDFETIKIVETRDNSGIVTAAIPKLEQIRAALTLVDEAYDAYQSLLSTAKEKYPKRISLKDNKHQIAVRSDNFESDLKVVLGEKFSQLISSLNPDAAEAHQLSQSVVNYFLYALKIIRDIETRLTVFKLTKDIHTLEINEILPLIEALAQIKGETGFYQLGENQAILRILQAIQFGLAKNLETKYANLFASKIISLIVITTIRGLLKVSKKDEEFHAEALNRIKLDSILRRTAKEYDRDTKKKEDFIRVIDQCETLQDQYNLIIEIVRPQVAKITTESLSYLLLIRLENEMPELFSGLEVKALNPEQTVKDLRSKLNITHSTPSTGSQNKITATLRRVRTRATSSYGAPAAQHQGRDLETSSESSGDNEAGDNPNPPQRKGANTPPPGS